MGTRTKPAPVETVIFSHENPDTKDVDIIDALRATASFPFAFAPHKVMINGEEQEFIDGGVLNNYPIDIFDEAGVPSPKTLGFKVDDAEECEEILFTDKRKNEDKVNFGHFKATENEGDVGQYYKYNTIQIFDADVWTLNFRLDPFTKMILKVSGEQEAKEYSVEGYHCKPTNRNEIVNALMQIGQDINKSDFAAVIGKFMFVMIEDHKLSVEVATRLIETLESFSTKGLTPNTRAEYDLLLEFARSIADKKPLEKQILDSIAEFMPTVAPMAAGGSLIGGGVGAGLALATGPVGIIAALSGLALGGAGIGIKKLVDIQKENAKKAKQAEPIDPRIANASVHAEIVAELIEQQNFERIWDLKSKHNLTLSTEQVKQTVLPGLICAQVYDFAIQALAECANNMSRQEINEIGNTFAKSRPAITLTADMRCKEFAFHAFTKMLANRHKARDEECEPQDLAKTEISKR